MDLEVTFRVFARLGALTWTYGGPGTSTPPALV